MGCDNPHGRKTPRRAFAGFGGEPARALMDAVVAMKDFACSVPKFRHCLGRRRVNATIMGRSAAESRNYHESISEK
jgi:hypothetical protein